MREQRIAYFGTGTKTGAAPFRSSSRPGRPDSVRTRQREALDSLRQAHGAGRPVAGEKRLGFLAKALGFLSNLW